MSSSLQNLQALSEYFFLIESEIDRKLFKAKYRSKKLHKIYEAIKPKEVVKKQEPKDDFFVMKTLAELDGVQLQKQENQKPELTDYEVFKQELQTFKQSPALHRDLCYNNFVNQLYSISRPTISHVQERLIQNLDLIIEELQKIHKENESNPHIVYKYRLLKESLAEVLDKYKEISTKYEATKQYDEIFAEPRTNTVETKTSPITVDDDIFSQSVDINSISRLHSIRNDARLSVMKYRLQNRGAEILIPAIDENPKDINDARDSCIIAKVATSLISQPNKNTLIVFNDPNE